MHRQKMLQVAITVILVLSFLVGCGSIVLTPTVETPASMATVESPTSARLSGLPTLSPDSMPGASGLGDSLYPGFGNGGYDVQHYTLDLIVREVDTSKLEGLTTIEAQATQNLSSFNLDFIGFTIDEITVNGQPAKFDRKGQELTITPPKPLEASEAFVVKVIYRGMPEEVYSVATSGQIGWVAFDGGSYVLSEPDGAATYYPVNDHPLDKATYTFHVTVPKPFEVAANGVLAETIDQGDTITFVWEERDAMAGYLATVNIGKFEIETETAPNGIPIRNYYDVGLAQNVRQPFARQGDMLAFYSDIFGTYAFETYGALILDTEVGTALESQTLSIYGVDQLDLENMPLAEQLAAHELAHQWFGDSLSLADWGDIWLNEGFATYAEGLWVEHTEGAEALDNWVKGMYAYVAEAGNDLVPPGKPPADDLFNEGVYCRGALTLHALRLQVGDEIFFDILRIYYDRFKDGNVRTGDFIAVSEEVSRQELDAFFESWLYSEEMPPIPALGLKVE